MTIIVKVGFWSIFFQDLLEKEKIECVIILKYKIQTPVLAIYSMSYNLLLWE